MLPERDTRTRERTHANTLSARASTRSSSDLTLCADVKMSAYMQANGDSAQLNMEDFACSVMSVPRTHQIM